MNNKNKVIIDLVLGDSGKGRLADFFSSQATHCVRFSGSSNAGHTIYIGEKKIVLHLIPAGILTDGIVNIVASGVMIDPIELLDEIHMLEKNGFTVNTSNLKIAANCHIVHKLHKAQDAYEEEQRGNLQIGTTKKGVGPCQKDKVAREGIRIQDLCHENRLRSLMPEIEYNKKAQLFGLHLSYKDFIAELYGAGQELQKYLIDVTLYMANTVIDSKNKFIFEGAQGALLDVGFGNYPYVTSTHCIGSYAAVSCGIHPKYLHEIVGVFKAYDTMVGSGFLPCRMEEDLEKIVQEKGKEFGSTTGRRRKCGHLDLVMLKYGARINGTDSLAITKLDVLSGLDNIKLCFAYTINNSFVTEMPLDRFELEHAIPNYITLPGWKEDISNIKHYEDLPKEIKLFLETIEDYLNLPIKYISTGPERNQMIKK